MQSVFHRALRRSPGASPQFSSLLDTGLPRSQPEGTLFQSRPSAQLRSQTHRHFSSRLPAAQRPQTFKHPRDLFRLDGKVYVVTGGGRGLGLTMAEALAEAGGTVHCLDCRPEAGPDFLAAQARSAADTESVGSLHYAQVDVRDVPQMEATFASIAAQKSRLDGLIAAAGIQRVQPAIDYSQAHMREMMDVNYGGVMFAAAAAARQMIACGTPGNIMLVASMSGKIANKGLISSVYNSSKAAVIQLGKNLAMEWAPHGIRVNSLSPGHIVTPMVQQNFDDEPHLEALWARENMMGRLSSPEEFKGAALFLLSDASTFMTGSELVIDGGHTAW
ncbi:hypothetical protein V493_02273 [Pseudogymnoascus sp. VKM F-4281 (FW-2241)]|nr:hypothetical protein V493_02273 [Pseudogymnoascus sp. VKM F-4281 (FW-2241)]